MGHDKQAWSKRLAKLPDEMEAYQKTAGQDQPARRLPDNDPERQTLVERLIQEAMAEGKFDNLPGKGKPLDLTENPYLEPGQEWAFGLLKRNGFAPEWIERDKAIRQELADMRARLCLAWQQQQADPADKSRWPVALAKFEERLHKLNRQIDDFNLIVPVLSAHRPRLRLEAELRRVQESE
jgi:DnaJ family protein C protein 28